MLGIRRAVYGSIGLLSASCLSSPTPNRAQHVRPAFYPTVGQPQSELAARLLAAHNRVRADARVAPLRWDPYLAASAATYGPTLASLGRLVHSPRAPRPGQSENLWMGSRGAYSPEQMVGRWEAEKAYFRPGIYPNVSTTGNWYDVSHHTQVIWPGTTSVGCAVYPSGKWDYLICRYSPKGNVDGQRVP